MSSHAGISAQNEPETSGRPTPARSSSGSLERSDTARTALIQMARLLGTVAARDALKGAAGNENPASAPADSHDP